MMEARQPVPPVQANANQQLSFSFLQPRRSALDNTAFLISAERFRFGPSSSDQIIEG